MSLKLKLNFLFVTLLTAISLLFIGFHSSAISSLNLKHTTQTLGLVSALGDAVKIYTEEEVASAFETLTEDSPSPAFPAYAVHQVFSGLNQEQYPVFLKTAIQGAEIERYQPQYWQASLIEEFQKNPATNQLMGQLANSRGDIHYFAEPLADQSEIIGATISYMYLDTSANTTYSFQQFLLFVIVVNLVLVVIFNLAMHSLALKPLKEFSNQSHQISQGHLEVGELQVPSLPELQIITESFKRQQRSLKAAMNMLSS